MDLTKSTVQDLQVALSKKEVSSVDVARAYLKNIEKKNPDINAYLEVFDDVESQAKEADKRIASGDVAPLTGIPIAVKDNILIEGRIASAASKMLENYVASYDATVISKLKSQGVVFLGRTNMDDAAMGTSSESSAFGPVKNPHDTTRVPGGSSGGSAAAVAAEMAPIALGSDTGGSIRQPASFCGVVGLKPTYGSVSRSGLIAMTSSIDVIGPVAKTVADAHIVFDVIKGKDAMDSTTVSREDYPSRSDRDVKTIGVPRHLFGDDLDAEVSKKFDAALDELEKKGFSIQDIEMKNLKYALPAYYIIVPAEASTNLDRLDGVRYGFHKDGSDMIDDFTQSRTGGFGPEPKRRTLMGAYVLSAGYYDAYYGKATQVVKKLKDDYAQAFSEVDIVAMPTTPTPPFKIGEKTDPLSLYLQDIFTTHANLSGVPGISVPMGTISEEGVGLPVGIQFIAPHLEEERLFSVSKIFLGEE